MQGFYNQNNFPGMNFNNMNDDANLNMENNTCKCNNNMNNNMNNQNCPTTFKTCPPIVTCSKQVLNQYHITKQPYIHNYHTEIVHHHVTQNEFIPNYTCSEVHVNEPDNSNYPR
jgi:hypothetical protein